MNQRKPFIVKTISIDDATASLPQISHLSEKLPDIDLYISAAGFEERVLAAPLALQKLKVQIRGKCLLGRYRTNIDENQDRERQLLPVIQKLGGQVDYFDADSPVCTKNAIDKCLNTLKGSPNVHVVFDVCGASSRLIFSVMGSLLNAEEEFRLTILYSSATKYHEPNPANRDKPVLEWGKQELREMGVAEVDHNELYQGMHQDHLPGYVIAFPSMFPIRLQRCLSHLGVGPLSGSGDNVFWVLPSTEDEDHKWRRDAILSSLASLICDECCDQEHPKSLPGDSYTTCDVFDYASSARIVMEKIEANPGTNISLIHMGTKLQAIGASIALAGRPEVALVGSRPESFAANSYSQGFGPVMSIGFDSQKRAVHTVAQIGSLEIVV